MKYKIEHKYLEQILLGNKNYEIRYFDKNKKKEMNYLKLCEYLKPPVTDFPIIKFEIPGKEDEEHYFKLKRLSKMKFKDIHLDILLNIFCHEYTGENKYCDDTLVGYYDEETDDMYDLDFYDEGLQKVYRLKEKDKEYFLEKYLKEMKRFYGEDFTEDSEVIVFRLDN